MSDPTTLPNTIPVGTTVRLDDPGPDAPRERLHDRVPKEWTVAAHECDEDGQWWYVLKTQILRPSVSYNYVMNVGPIGKDYMTVTYRVPFSARAPEKDGTA
jgi:hypothetical protein